MSVDVVVIGGGIAGLSVAARLASVCEVQLFERDRTLGARASGRNAAIYRPLEDDDTSAALARRSRELLEYGAEHPVLSPVGLLLVSASALDMQAQRARAVAQDVAHRELSGAELARVQPHLSGGEAGLGLLLPEGGVLDIHEILATLERTARASGAAITTGLGVQRVLAQDGRVQGVQLADGRRVAAAHVVIVAGAWSAGLSEGLGLPMPLQPRRRHLVQLKPQAPAASRRAHPAGAGPVAWRLDDEVYFRAEGAGLLCSPCDETIWPAGEVAADPRVLEVLAEKLVRLAPTLAGAGTQTAWACLRTFAPDRQLVVGPDPRLQGLHWLSGLGGKGMSVAPAAGELLAQAIERSERVTPALWTGRLFR